MREKEKVFGEVLEKKKQKLYRLQKRWYKKPPICIFQKG